MGEISSEPHDQVLGTVVVGTRVQEFFYFQLFVAIYFNGWRGSEPGRAPGPRWLVLGWIRARPDALSWRPATIDGMRERI